MSLLKTALAGTALLALLAACEKEVILPGERFGTRTPLEASLPSEANPRPTDPSAQVIRTAVPIALPGAVANADWPMRAGNARHLPPHGSLSAAPQLLWSASIGQGNSKRNRISAAPVVAGGRIFTLDALAGLQATALNGAPLWTADLTPPGDRASEVSGGGLGFGAGRLFVATGYGELIAVDPASGAVQWRQRLGAAVTGAPAVEGDTVYIVGRDGSGWAVAAADGKVRWTVPGAAGAIGMIGASAPAVSDTAVLFPTPAGEVIATSRSGGLEQWRARIVGQRLGRAYAGITELTGDPVVSGSTVFAGNAAGRSYALSASTGETLWTAPEGALGPMLPVGGSVFMVNDQAQLVRLDASTGALVWAVDMPYFDTDKPKKRKAVTAHFGPVLAGGRIAVVSGDGLLRLFSPVDGTLVGSAEVPGGAATLPALAGGMLFVVGGNGQLHAFR
ncbi:MAG: PQQ-binding-like beta-propeller repeat protein [Gemmobacter sp.]|nr:PQQ-binding-like beta-propeller repeat protein [Gemmobacter sp.]